jgi:serine/threonine protein kinase
VAAEALGAATVAGHFALLEELGSGSSGTVYRARLEDDYGTLPAGHEVAVKFLRQDRLADSRARNRLLAEGRLGQRVQHPNVAAIFGIESITVLGLEITYLIRGVRPNSPMATTSVDSSSPRSCRSARKAGNAWSKSGQSRFLSLGKLFWCVSQQVLTPSV